MLENSGGGSVADDGRGTSTAGHGGVLECEKCVCVCVCVIRNDFLVINKKKVTVNNRILISGFDL